MSEAKEVTIDYIINKQKENYPNSDSDLIMKAYEFAKSNHGDQLRKSGEPYMIHPVNVAGILIEEETTAE